ncbi:hypothetical protein LINPERHAP1_LOCUS14359 [Linum perenne]
MTTLLEVTQFQFQILILFIPFNFD